MKIYHNKLTNQMIVVKPEHAQCIYIPSGTDPIDYAIEHLSKLGEPLVKFDLCAFVADTEQQDTKEPEPTPNQNAPKTDYDKYPTEPNVK